MTKSSILNAEEGINHLFLIFMRNTVRILSGIGLGIHLFFLMLLGSASGLSDTSSEASSGTMLLLSLPFIYFGFCLWSSYGHLRGLSLFIGGVLAHLCVLPFIIRLCHDGVPYFALPILLVALSWAGMYYEFLTSPDA